MRKVIKLYLNQGYTPIHTESLKVGTHLDFDCYIQRFNGFVIIIEKGTLLDEKTYHQITRNTLPLYVYNQSYTDYKAYYEKHHGKIYVQKNPVEDLDINKETEKALAILGALATLDDSSEKLKAVYTNIRNILNAWLRLEVKKSLPIEALNHLVEVLIGIMNKENITFSKFNYFLDTYDSLASHCVKVGFYVALMGREIGLDLEDQRKLVLASVLHDIGTCDIDESLIDKPDFLTQEEHKVLQQHVEASVKIIKRSGLKDRYIIFAVKEHHERLDGSGYPSGLLEKRISKFAKIIAICDMFDALTTVKSYRGAYTTFNALSLIRQEGRQKFDMNYVNILIKLLS